MASLNRTCSIPECERHTHARGWCELHYRRAIKHGSPRVVKQPGNKPVDPVQRFWAKVQKTDTCWLWVASKDPRGYGRFGIDRTNRSSLAHRYSYELAHGPIPNGLTIDHLCRVRHCVNPTHLEAVTLQENWYRGTGGLVHSSKTQCPQGHAYDEENTILYKGRRYCRQCQRVYIRAWKHLRRAKA